MQYISFFHKSIIIIQYFFKKLFDNMEILKIKKIQKKIRDIL